jgi:hypothetical protein
MLDKFNPKDGANNILQNKGNGTYLKW